MLDQDLMTQIQYHLIETPDGGQSWSSGLWTRDEVLAYINERQDHFVKQTHIRVEKATIPILTGVYRYDLPDDWVSTIRVYWNPDGLGLPHKPLVRSDSWEADHGIPNWTTQGVPKLYMDGDVPTLTIQVAPVPIEDGSIEVIYVANCDPVNGNGVDFTVVDEFMPIIKYGVMADMLSKVGRAQDMKRAEYCEKRYQMGIEIARILLKGYRR